MKGRSLEEVDARLLAGNCAYKYVSGNPHAPTGDEFFAQGQSFVLRVGAGGQFEGNSGPAITGASTWVPITNPVGGPIAGVSTVLPDGTIDGRVTADQATVRSTGYNRPEDLEIQTLADGTQLLYFNTTDSDTNASSADGVGSTYNVNLTTNVVRLFADASTIPDTTVLGDRDVRGFQCQCECALTLLGCGTVR